MKTELIRNLSVALLAAASAFAQGPQTLIFPIPFPFHVGASVLPAGDYTVDTNAAPGVIRMRSADCKSAVMIIANAVEAQAAATRGKLVFNKYGDEYFLSQLWKPGSNVGKQLPQTRREIELAAAVRRGLEPVVAKK